MVFSSSLFLLYFLPIFLLIYFLIDKKYKNGFGLFASVFFYAWGAPEFIFVVLGSIFIDFYLVQWMNDSVGRKKIILVGLSVLLNIGLLLYYKYANFFVDNLNVFVQGLGYKEIPWAAVALPIGISFFTFQKLTYSIDVYRKVHAPLKHIRDYALYILMFPQLIAGPIIRFNEIADQLEERQANENIDNRLTGFFRFILGLAKKVLIANVLGEQVDIIFALGQDDLSTPLAWIGVIAYAFQIYFDFSGYSDMAIGIGRMIGFDFPENFNNPYISRSISEFWRRWHITLGRFMRDYLYIPLGGNRVSVKRVFFNLWIVFLLSGLWHGAAWTFVIWGAFHGAFLVADRIFLLKVYKKIGKIPSIIITFIITLIGWVLFRADTLHAAGEYLHQMFAFDFTGAMIHLDAHFYTMFIFATIFSFWAIIPGVEKWQMKLLSKEQRNTTIIIMVLVSIIFLIICLGSITSQGFNPFIYFRF